MISDRVSQFLIFSDTGGRGGKPFSKFLTDKGGRGGLDPPIFG